MCPLKKVGLLRGIVAISSSSSLKACMSARRRLPLRLLVPLFPLPYLVLAPISSLRLLPVPSLWLLPTPALVLTTPILLRFLGSFLCRMVPSGSALFFIPPPSDGLAACSAAREGCISLPLRDCLVRAMLLAAIVECGGKVESVLKRGVCGEDICRQSGIQS